MGIVRILLITAHESTGAGRAVIRLNEGLRARNVDSSVLTLHRSSDRSEVFSPGTAKEKYMKLISLVGTKLVNKFTKEGSEIFSANVLPSFILSEVEARMPDIVHLHWVGQELFRIEDLSRIQGRLIWTLHDSWAFTGGCHVPHECRRYEQSCGFCPQLKGRRENDLSRWIYRRKLKTYRKLRNPVIVTPSRWLGDCSKSSSLFRNFRVEVIPNGINATRFRPVQKKVAREILGLPVSKKLILFGAIRAVTDRNKGFHLLIPALRKVWQHSADCAVTIFGSCSFEVPKDIGIPVHIMGRLHDDTTIALLYSAADVMVVPSLIENLPNTILESMACGTPCVAFDVGGIADLIEHKVTGYLACPYDPNDLAEGILHVLHENAHSGLLSHAVREKAVSLYSIQMVAERYEALYQEVMNSP